MDHPQVPTSATDPIQRRQNISNRKIMGKISINYWSVFALVVIVVSVFVGVYLVRNPLKRDSQAASAPVGISLSPSQGTISSGSKLDIVYNPGGNLVGFSEFEITFDSSKIKLSNEITVNNYFGKLVVKTTRDEANSTGRIKLALGLEPGKTPTTNQVVLGSITFTPSTTSSNVSAAISFDSSHIQIVDTSRNTLAYNLTNGAYTVNPTSATLTPTTNPTTTIPPKASPTQPPSNSGPTATPTTRPTSTPTNKPTATPTMSNSSGPTPTLPPIMPGKGIWISKEEIMSIPASGAAWDRLKNAANSSWGSAKLGDNNSDHDVKTLAGALVATRLNDSNMRSKTIQGLQSAMNSSLSRSLELSRGLQTYIIAADIIGYQDSAFKSWVREMLNANVSAHMGGSSLCNSSGTSYSCSGVGGVRCTAQRSANNWGGHARASVAAAAVYLGDSSLLQEVTNAYKAFIGLSVPNHLYCESTNWHADSSNKFGINRKGSTISGKNVSGVLPEDWRRSTNFQWPPVDSGYMWEGLQGTVVTGVILHRAGTVPFNSSENAIVRAFNMLYGYGEAANNSPVYVNKAAGDDTWQPWVVNYYAGTNFPTGAATSGKNMGWTDWTHAR